MDQWTNGPMDQWNNGPMDQRTNGPIDQWTNGLMDQWTNGPMVQWSNGPMVQWSNGPMDQWTNGPMDQWTNGPTDQWTNGPMDQWTNWLMDQWTNGPIIQCIALQWSNGHSTFKILLWRQLHWYCFSNLEWHLWILPSSKPVLISPLCVGRQESWSEAKREWKAGFGGHSGTTINPRSLKV